MAQYTYTAALPNGSNQNGTIDATNRSGALSALGKRGLRPITLKEKKSGGLPFGISGKLGGRKVKSDALVIFTRQLSTMVSAGVPLLRAINSLQVHTESKALSAVLEDVTKDIRGGLALGDALAKHPNVFSDVYVNMVRAGETAGILDEILKRLAVQQEKNATIRKKVKGAMTYPMVLIAITTIAFFGLMIFVVPQIGTIILEMSGPNAKLPLLTRVMLSISGFMQTYWYIVLGLVLGLVLGFRRYVKTDGGKKRFHALILKMPILKGVITKVAVARFARTFSSLIGAGVSVTESLMVTGRAIGNKVYERDITDAVEQIKNGKQLSQVLGDNPLFPAILSQMLAVGEETGQTDVVLLKVADYYEEEVDTVIGSLSSIIEPLMIVIMGGMVGLVVASVIQPITSLAQNIQG